MWALPIQNFKRLIASTSGLSSVMVLDCRHVVRSLPNTFLWQHLRWQDASYKVSPFNFSENKKCAAPHQKLLSRLILWRRVRAAWVSAETFSPQATRNFRAFLGRFMSISITSDIPRSLSNSLFLAPCLLYCSRSLYYCADCRCLISGSLILWISSSANR